MLSSILYGVLNSMTIEAGRQYRIAEVSSGLVEWTVTVDDVQNGTVSYRYDHRNSNETKELDVADFRRSYLPVEDHTE